MHTHSLIRVEQVCRQYGVEDHFIRALHELGHIEVVVENNVHYINLEQLRMLESMIYFYTELKINIEGIDAIANLLQQIQDLQDELRVVKSKLSLFVKE